MHLNPAIRNSRRIAPRITWSRLTHFLLILALLANVLPRIARANSSEKELVGLTKTTIYGGLLGGLLGLTSALIVKEDSRDDAIRWGVAMGAFTGFAYGIFSIVQGSDEFSWVPDEIRPARMNSGGTLVAHAGVVRRGRLGSHPCGIFRGDAEVVHDRFEKENDRKECRVEEGGGTPSIERRASSGEAGEARTRPE